MSPPSPQILALCLLGTAVALQAQAVEVDSPIQPCQRASGISPSEVVVEELAMPGE